MEPCGVGQLLSDPPRSRMAKYKGTNIKAVKQCSGELFLVEGSVCLVLVWSASEKSLVRVNSLSLMSVFL